MDEDGCSSSGSDRTFFERCSLTEAAQLTRTGSYGNGTIGEFRNTEMDEVCPENIEMETSPYNGSSGSSTNYVESETAAEIANEDLMSNGDMGDFGNPNQEVTVSICSSIASLTNYDETFINQNRDDLDVIDGPDSPGTASQKNDAEEQIACSSTNFVRCSSNGCLPPPPTDSERIARTTEWVIDSDSNDDVEEDESYRRATAIDYIENLIKLCAEKLDNCPLFLSTVGSVAEFNDECETVFQLIVTLLQTNYITEALMQIINLIWAMGRDASGAYKPIVDHNNKNCKSRELMLMILNSASPVGTRLYQTTIEKILSHNIFMDAEYFQFVSLCTNIKTPSKEFTIFQRIETWINKALDLSLECRTTIIDLDIRIILEVIREVNIERNLYLSPEEESKYAAKAQRVVRETFFNRCHAFLRSQGFVFEVLSQRPTLEMASYLPRSVTDRIVPNMQLLTGRDQRYLEDPYVRNEIIEAIYALEQDDRSMERGGSSPQYNSSQGSVASLREDVVQFDDGQWARLSQDSLESRMNQGYASSQNSWSQGSLPRIPSSQSSVNSGILRFIQLDNQYILENQFQSSSPESSQEPPWKRFRYNNPTNSQQ